MRLVEGIMKKFVYLEILQLLESIEIQEFDMSIVVFQQENHPKHTSVFIKD